MIKTMIAGADGEKTLVLPEGELLTNEYTCPPMIPQKNRIFSQKFTTDGLPSGISEMGVDGSVTPVDYYIPADPDDDRYVTRMSFILGYGLSAQLYEFADSGAPLTNGVRVWYRDTIGNEIDIMNPKANYSFQRASCACISNDSWESRGFAAAGDYGYFVSISLHEIIPKFGVKLDRGTNQRITITIRDNCTDADLFNCQAFGFNRFA